ncbi:hypothetical protein MW887_002487 [Aspergillus wentii]|nr:hypothetical protein MW887_002487 [Aspergillus wentii]
MPLTWLITGCSSGFGLSLARLVQANGHSLIATSRNPSRTPSLVSEIESNGGKWLSLDVDDLNCASLIHELESAGQHIDVLVNNAGFSILAPGEILTDKELRDMMETLYFGPQRLIQAVLPYMRGRRSGVVVNVSSGAALEGRESMGGYAAAKAAMDGMARVLSKEVTPFNIRILTLWLGTFNTNFGNAIPQHTNPIPDDYEGTLVSTFMKAITGGNFTPDGDKDKAMKALYEVVVGEGG